MIERPRISPVLVGRDDLLELAERRASSVRAGTGHVLFLAGEAGIGKTRLLGAILRSAQRHALHTLTAAAFPRDLELAGAPLLDLADQLGRDRNAARRARGRAIRDGLLAATDEAIGDRHRQRRLLVHDLAALVAGLADDAPVALALEDLHWADDLTLEVTARLARHVRDRPMLVIGTYRSDELYPRVPMREWRSRLLTQRLAEEIRLPRLDLEQTARMTTLLSGSELPAPRHLIEILHRRSDGIPLHIEELIAVAPPGEPDVDPTPTTTLPDSLADAVLQRAAGLSDPARRVAGAAAIVGRSFDLDLLAAVDGGRPDGVSRAIVELERRSFLVSVGDGWYDVRHALIRDALEVAVDPARRRRLHARVAAAAAERPEIGSDAFLSAHFELAGRRTEAFHHARVAAARASALSSHREALQLVRRALRTAPRDLPPRERAALLRSAAAEEAANDGNAAAAAALEEARELLLGVGDRIAAAELLPPLVAARHLLGDGLDGRSAALESELAEDDSGRTLPPGTRGRLLAALSAAHMLDRRLDEAITFGEAAVALATADDDLTTRLHVQATVGSCLVFAGRMGEGWSMLEAAVNHAREARREAEAARAYRMLGTSASVLVEYERADRWLREGIEYAERTEQWNHRHYMAAHLAHVAWARGDWDAAEEMGDRALADGRGGLTTTITALHVRGFVALGRGDHRRAAEALTEARRLGEQMNELQRLSPAVWGLAESALLSGSTDDAIELARIGFDASARVADAAYLLPFLVTGTRARIATGDPRAAEEWVAAVGAELERRAIPGTRAALAHAGGLLALARGSTGEARAKLVEARAGWQERGRWWEGTWAVLDLARCQHRANRPADASALVAEVEREATPRGAAPILEAAAELGARLRARRPGEAAWAPLSAREFQVARLIAEGMTNREIAGELSIAPKTVAAHVEHILGRLGASRRAEIAAWVASTDPARR